MDSVQCYRVMSKSVATVTLVRPPEEPIRLCGIIVALKAGSAYVVTDAALYEEYLNNSQIIVQFPDQKTTFPRHNRIRIHSGILGIYCCLRSRQQFDNDLVEMVQFSGEALRPCQQVFIYDAVEDLVTEGSATVIYQQQFNVTNIVSYCANNAAPVVNTNGRVVGMCHFFEYHIRARSICAIAKAIERSFNRRFTSIQDTFDYLNGII